MLGLNQEKSSAAGPSNDIGNAKENVSANQEWSLPTAPSSTPMNSAASEDHEDQNHLQNKDFKPEDPLLHLPDHEAAIIRRQLDIPPVTISYFGLYRYATRTDILILIISAICAIAAGAAMPLMTVIFGSLANNFGDFVNDPDDALDKFESRVNTLTLYLVYLAIAEAITVYVSTVGFIYVGEALTAKIREHYLRAILRQNIGYFDKLGAGQITTRITSDISLIQEGISEKVGLTLTAIATFVSAYVIGYIRYWKLTLILTSSIVAIVLTMGLAHGKIVKFAKESIIASAVGGSVVEEVISSIRTATAFGTQDRLANKFDVHLNISEKAGFKMKSLTGSMVGFLMCFISLTYALAFWLGSRYVTGGETGLAQVITIILAIQTAAFSLGGVAPNIQAFNSAVAAASGIFATIDRKSPMDPESDLGEKCHPIEGYIDLVRIRHVYPSRPEVVVMDDVSLTIPAGKTTALVGASGSGKSTIIGLIERFYDPVDGKILIDGHDVRDLNLRWLRQQISLVSQEPTLFATTIAENIRHGLIGTKHEKVYDEKTRSLIEDAAKMANAHDFITQLPQGYNTNVGERGFLLSGGQKQRIAIARAIVSDPKILLLDEATSALDAKSESIVQAALDKAAKGRTTVVIAHRLSTMKHADNIIVISEGRIVEQGTHNVLIENRNTYYNLVEAQNLENENGKERADETAQSEEVSYHAHHVNQTDETLVGQADALQQDIRTQGKSADGHLENEKTLVLGHTPTEIADTKKTKHSLWALLKLIASFNIEDWYWMVLGLASSIISGAVQPVQAIFFAKSISILSLGYFPSQRNHVLSQMSFWAWMYFMSAIVLLISFVAQGIFFAFCSERLVHRSRYRLCRTILRQNIAFFDAPENSAGALTSFLNTEPLHLAGMSGINLGTILQVLTTLIVGYVIALVAGWKLALVCISTVPLVLGCGFVRVWMLAHFQARAKKAYEASASYACEVTSAIRTVASLTRERDVWKQYHAQLEAQASESLKSVLKSSILYAASQSMLFLCFALGFWYGSKLIGRGEYDLYTFILVFTAIIFGSQSAGVIFSSAPDMGKAKHAAREMKIIFDSKPSIDTGSNGGQNPGNTKGSVEFRAVHFHYPTRPEVPVLRGLSLSVQPGQYVALVGASGCGKSTMIAMLERFYDPTAGGIYLDGQDISTLNVKAYRNILALVSQEPTLYQGTIRENILLGIDQKPEDVSEEAIIQACKDANIYDFIVSLPDTFATMCGPKGTLLSGGQKQRIAIARALLRNPRILLLDEATSALDSESEQVVQDALDKAARGRTTIAVAHRLSSIQKADIIYVLDEGRIVEQGTHHELIAKRGEYFDLVNMQSLGENS